MVVTRLHGGLGNQLFQYALGRAIAQIRNTSLLFDTAMFERDKLRTYKLWHFSVTGRPLTLQERKAFGLATPKDGRFSRIVLRLKRKKLLHTVHERSFAFDPNVLRAPDDCYLQGYWQSPKYFAAIDGIIRRELQTDDPLSNEDSAVADQIRRCESVAVHVRRGDYVSNPVTHRFHGTCSNQYYAAAEETLIRRLGDLTLFVFSDDPDWVECNLRFHSRTVVVRHNGPERDYADLRLMKLCRHHVIANSTFSWWSAWLCTEPFKIVIAPKGWFVGPDQSTDDLIPPEWLRL